MITKPESLARVHREICEQAGCRWLDRVDYLDPCAACPAGHWPRYVRKGCENGPRSHPRRLWRRPGTLLARWLGRLGIRPNTQCGCHEKAARMDEWGWLECFHRRQEVLSWLATAAYGLGYHRLRKPSWIALIGVYLIERCGSAAVPLQSPRKRAAVLKPLR